MSTVRGKKSAPSRTDRDAVAVARSTVSPIRATTAPSASFASFPVSNVRVRSVPLMGADTVMASAMVLLFIQGHSTAGSQWSTTSDRYRSRPWWERRAEGNRRLAADGSDCPPISIRTPDRKAGRRVAL